MNKELTLEEAENIVDNMYQNRWKECGVEDGNTIHMGNLSNLKYNELESASILLLRTEIRLKKENKILKENAENNDKVVDKVNWENQLLKKENKQVKDSWNKLKEGSKVRDNIGLEKICLEDIVYKMVALEKGRDNSE